jgi:hypothetical protein
MKVGAVFPHTQGGRQLWGVRVSVERHCHACGARQQSCRAGTHRGQQ